MAATNCPHCHKQFETEQEQDKIIHCPHCNGTVSVPDENDIAPGNMIGGFEIIRLLGKGGMGNVYLANQTSMSRNVALKVLPKQLTQNKDSVEKFMREVRTSGRLQHGNIVTAIDAGEENGQYYLAMTYVEGETLEDIIDRGEIVSEKDALKYALKISDALAYVWSRHSTLHKDIKPGNIMIDANAVAFVLDMGIAQRLGESSLNDDGSILGSPFYMSPEQSRGENLTWSSDLYSLGASLYHAVVGEPPFDSDDVQEIIDQHTSAPFPEPSQRNPKVKVSKPMVALIRKMMAKRPEERYKSWDDSQKAMRQCLKELSKPKKSKDSKKQRSEKKKVSSTPRIRKTRGKRKSSAAPTLLVALILLALAVGGGYFIFQSIKERNALTAYTEAIEYLSRNPTRASYALDQFRRALAAAEGTKYQEEVAKKIETLERLVADKKNTAEAFKRHYYESKSLFKERRFGDARDALAKLPDALTAAQKNQADGLRTAIDNAIARHGAGVGKSSSTPVVRDDAPRREDLPKERAKTPLPSDVADGGGSEPQAERRAAFEEDLSLCKEKIRVITVGYGMKKEYHKARELVKSLRKQLSHQHRASSGKEIEAFGTWSDHMLNAVNGAEETWLTFFNCGKTLDGAKLTTEVFVNGEVRKIEHGKIYVIHKAKGETRKTIVNLSDLTITQMLPLLKELGKKSLDRGKIFSFFLTSGEFALAKKLGNDNPFWRAELPKTTKAYMLFRLRKMYKVLNSRFIDDFDKNDVKQAFSEFQGKYQDLPEFKSALRAVEDKY